MSGGGQSGTQETTKTQVAEPWSEQAPYLKDIFSEAQNRYNSGGPSYFPEATVTPFAPQTEMALNATENRALMGSPLNFAAQNTVLDTLQGNYLNQGNPAFQNLVDTVSGDVRQRVDSIYNAGNRGPSAGYAESLGRGIGDAISPYAFSNYENERNRQMGAAQLAPQLAANDYFDMAQLGNVGAARQSQAQRVLDSDIARFNYNETLPDMLLNDYLARIGGNYGGTTTGAVNQPLYSNGLAMGLGGAASGASTGFMIGGPYGAAIGGGLGLLGGLVG